jgi:hypothetical protein
MQNEKPNVQKVKSENKNSDSLLENSVKFLPLLFKANLLQQFDHIPNEKNRKSTFKNLRRKRNNRKL